MPQRKKSDQDGRQWWVSAWMPALDGYDLILSPELTSVPNRREVVLKKPLPGDDAVVTAVQLLTELRIRSAFARGGDVAERDPQMRPTRVDAATTSLNVFRTAPNRTTPERVPTDSSVG